MKGHLLNLAAAVSLVLLIAVASLWVRSYWHVDLVGRQGVETADHWQRGGHGSSAGGLLHVDWWLRDNGPSSSRPRAPGWAYESWPVRSPSAAPSWHGFGYEAVSYDHSPVASDGRPMPIRMTHSHRVTVPHWFILLLTLPAIGLWLRREMRTRRTMNRLRQNRCAGCGYDLRTSLGRCPECGAVSPAQL
jgi:hypothetical protein